MNFKEHQVITVIDRHVSPYPMTGEILELDTHPIGDSFAKIRVSSSPCNPVPEVWVNLRLAR